MRTPFRVGEWLAEPDLNTFRRGVEAVRVEPKVMELCVRLAQNAGAVVSKAELLDSVWADASVGEDALTRAVSELRRALGDDARNPRILETIPKRGYRLIPSGETAAASIQADPVTTPTRRWMWMLLATAGTAAVVVGGAIGMRSRGSPLSVPSAAPPTQVLVVVENTADGKFRDIVRERLETELTYGGALVVVPPVAVGEMLTRMRRSASDVGDMNTAREIALRNAGIGAIVLARVAAGTRRYDAHLQALNATGEQELWNGDAGGDTLEQAATDIRRNAQALRRALASFTPEPRHQLPPVTTSSLEALQYFARGVEIADSILPAAAGSWPKSIELFEKAVRDDREFAMAQVFLALAIKFSEDTNLSARGGSRPAADEFRGHAREALALAHQSSVPARERLFIEGAAGMLLEQRTAAIAAFEALVAIDPSFFEVRTRSLLASLDAIEGRWAEQTPHVLRLAEILPTDLDTNVAAAEALMRADHPDPDRIASFVDQARRALAPSVAQRENSNWSASWVEHFPVYERWAAGDIAAAIAEETRLTAASTSTVSGQRDSMGTTSGYFWLTFGRLREGRQAFESVGHTGQRELNLALIADLLDDRGSMSDHLLRQGWGYNPVLFARAGLFERAHQIMAEPTIAGQRPATDGIARGEEALAGGRAHQAIGLLQPAVDLLRPRPTTTFYNASLSLANAWRAAGDRVQRVRVLEEAAQAKPAYTDPGLAGAWWVKVQTELTNAYCADGRYDAAGKVLARVRALLAFADPDFPLLHRLPAACPNQQSVLSGSAPMRRRYD